MEHKFPGPSRTRWPWVWANSGSWWWTGKPGVLQSRGSQRVGHDWETEEQHQDLFLQVPWATECLSPPWTPSWGVEGQQLQQLGVQSPERHTANCLVVIQSLANAVHCGQAQSHLNLFIPACWRDNRKYICFWKKKKNNSRLWVLWDDPRESFRISLDPEKQSFWNWAAGFRIQRACKNPNTCISFPGHWIKISWGLG